MATKNNSMRSSGSAAAHSSVPTRKSGHDAPTTAQRRTGASDASAARAAQVRQEMVAQQTQQAQQANQLASILAEAPVSVQQALVDMVRAASVAAEAREQGGVGGAGQHEAVAEVIAGLEHIVPVLHQYPTAMLSLERLLQRANAQAYAATVPPYATTGYADMVRAGGGSDGRPSGTVGQSISAGPTFSFLSTSGREQPQGVPNARQLRNWADSVAWLRAAIDVRREQIGHADIDVLPVDMKRALSSSSRRVQATMKTLLSQPNRLGQNWSEFIGTVLEDYLVLARGAIEKVQDLGGRPLELYPLNAAGLKIYPSWDGNPDLPRYLYEDPETSLGDEGKRPLFNDEAIVMMGNPGSYRFSLSPVQVLVEEIQADIAAMKAAKKTVALRPPANLVNLPGTAQLTLDALARRLESEFAGKKDLALIGTEPGVAAQVFSLVSSAKDSQFLELQIYLARKICAVMRISPQQVGITFDINRANGEVQQDISSDTGRIPVFLVVEHYLNRELMGDFAPYLKDGWRRDLDALNLRCVFPEISESARLQHVMKVAGLLADGLSGLPFMTLNMALAAMGEEPVPHGFGNTFVFPTASGLLITGSYDLDLENGDWNGAGATGPEEGAQDAAGGPNAEEGDMDDAPNEAPNEAPDGGNAGGNAGGDAQPASGGAGQDGAAGDGSGSSSGSSGAAGAATSTGKSARNDRRERRERRERTRQQIIQYATRPAPAHRLADTRPPGKAWQPFHTAGGAQLAEHVASPTQASTRTSAVHGQPPQDGYDASQLLRHHSPLSGDPVRLGVRGKHAKANRLEDPTTKSAPTGQKAMGDAGSGAEPAPPAITPVGRAPATMRENYRRSRGKQQAMDDLEEEARAIFLAAAQRGQEA